MAHKWVAGAAGVFTIALVMGAGAAGAEELKMASLTTTLVASAQTSDAVQPRAMDLGSAQASQADLAALAADKPVEPAKSARKPKAGKHKSCVHGEWVSQEDYNPFTLSCTVVGF